MKQPYHDLFLMRIHEIESSLDKGLYISALALALTLPDICGKAEYPTDGTGTRYKKWYSKHVEPLYMWNPNDRFTVELHGVFSIREDLQLDIEGILRIFNRVHKENSGVTFIIKS